MCAFLRQSNPGRLSILLLDRRRLHRPGATAPREIRGNDDILNRLVLPIASSKQPLPTSGRLRER